MYSITFDPSDKKETYISNAGKPLFRPFGDIITQILRINTDNDIDTFLKDYDCYGYDLQNLVQYDSFTGTVEKPHTIDFYSTIRNEKSHLLYVLNLYETSKRQYPLSNNKYSIGKAAIPDPKSNSKNKLPDIILPDTYELLKDSINYSRIENILDEHALGRLSHISISLYAEAQKQRVKGLAKEFTRHGENISTHLRTGKFITMGFTYKYSSNDFLSLPWLEFIETVKQGFLPNICDTCGNYYFNAQRKTSEDCYICGPKSRNPSKKTDEIRERNNIIRRIQNGLSKGKGLSIEEGNKLLKEKGLKEYKHHNKKERE